MKHIARKRFGQHFLSDAGIIDAIVREIAPRPGDAMVEIGPGLAALTQPLVERLGRLTVIELDRDLAQRLRAHGQLEVIESDVLKVDFAALAARLVVPPATALRVVGNLPYNISTPILFHLLDFAHLVADQHFMLQKEVIDRMTAQPATSDYGRLSVMLQWRYAMENVLFVPPRASIRRRGWTAPWCAWCPWPSRHRSTRPGSARSSRSPSASAASCCVIAWASGWSNMASPASSRHSGAPKRCLWPNTSPWRSQFHTHRKARRRRAFSVREGHRAPPPEAVGSAWRRDVRAALGEPTMPRRASSPH